MSEQSQLGPSYDGTVLLDIGGDIGALVIYTSVLLHQVEIEISPVGDQAADVFQLGHGHTTSAVTEHVHTDGEPPHTHGGPHRTHVAVRERRGPSGVRYAAIYPGLRAGDYTIWGSDGQPAETVTIVGGEVAQIDWR